MGLTAWLWGADAAAAGPVTLPVPREPSPPPGPSASSSAAPAAANPAATEASPPTAVSPPAGEESETRRMLRQLTLPLFGTSFLLLSLSLTRRSLRRRLAPPPFYHQSNAPPIVPPSGALDAFEALQLATLNVVSMAMIMVGAGAFMLDVSSVAELRQRVQDKMNEGGPEGAGVRQKAEEEFEEWMVEILARKEVKERAKKVVDQAIVEKK